MALHESKLLRWELRASDLVVRASDLLVRLDAYVHVSLGVPGKEQGTGWSQELSLVLRNARVTQEPGELPLWITGGAVHELELFVPVPFEVSAQVELSLSGAAGTLAASGEGLSLTPLGEPRFVERFEGA